MARGFYLGKMVALLILLFGACANASSMAAWSTPFGTSLVILNTTTGIVSSSFCNSSALVFPVHPPNFLDVGITPIKGTNLAATGYYDGQTSWASIFYLDEDLNIVSHLYSCDNSTGRYRRQNTRILQVAPGSSKTGLAVILPDSDKLTYEFFYSYSQNHIHQAVGDSQGLHYAGVVSQDNDIVGHVLGATSFASSSTKQFSIVVAPKGTQNIEVMDSDGSDNWHITTFPQSLTRHHNQDDPSDSFTYSNEAPSFTLPAWTGNPGALGIALDSDYRYHVLYIGSDRRIHHMATGPPEMWTLMPDQESAFWPLADDPNADFAFVSNAKTSTMSIYYVSNGALIQARFEDGKWQPAAPVLRASFVKASCTSRLTRRHVDKSEETFSTWSGFPGFANQLPETTNGNSSGKMFALGFGLGFGLLAVILVVIGGVWLFRRQRRAKAQAKISELPVEMMSFDKYQIPASASGHDTTSRPQTRSGDGLTSAPVPLADPERHEVGPRPSVFDDSDSDGNETVLSERWNKKPGGPGFEHVKPYDDFGTLKWRQSMRRARSTACVGESSKSECSLPQKSKTTGQLLDCKSTSDLPDASWDEDSFTLPIQNHD